MNSCPTSRRRSRKSPRPAGFRWKSCRRAPRRCMNPTPCWAIAAAGWALPIRKSMKCRPAPSWRRPPMSMAAGGKPVQLEIMIPLVGFKTELDRLAARIAQVAEDIKKTKGTVPDYMIGTMIELPRAALARGGDRRDRRILFLRHQRSHPDHARSVARRCRHVPQRVHQQGRDRARSVRLDRRRWRRRIDPHRRRRADARRATVSSSASAASMAAIRTPFASATTPDWIMSPARHSAFRSRDWRRRRRRLRNVAKKPDSIYLRTQENTGFFQRSMTLCQICENFHLTIRVWLRQTALPIGVPWEPFGTF